jgi:hypothetical protein
MRLLNVYNLSFCIFAEQQLPPYAIASHRWEEDEATFAQVRDHVDEWRKGFKKIQRFCSFICRRNNLVKDLPRDEVRVGRIEWLWIDTACIDKTSSQEINENITSMYRYYERAEECYAFLSDVDTREQFTRSLWFTRGWTLQELLAPRNVIFLSRKWTILGHKSHHRTTRTAAGYHRSGVEWARPVLNDEITAVTSISSPILTRKENPKTLPHKTILAWMNKRKTTRKEDEAYCLLGLLDISMVPNYGEGMNALWRLIAEVKRRQTVQKDNTLLVRAAKSKELDDETRAALARFEREQLMNAPIQEIPRTLPTHQCEATAADFTKYTGVDKYPSYSVGSAASGGAPVQDSKPGTGADDESRDKDQGDSEAPDKDDQPDRDPPGPSSSRKKTSSGDRKYDGQPKSKLNYDTPAIQLANNVMKKQAAYTWA